MVDYTGFSNYGMTRLDGSVVLVKGMPAYIHRINGDSMEYSRPGSMVSSIADIEDMNNSDLPLGFMNGKGRLSYLVRAPARQWRQGLRKQSIIDIVSGRHIALEEFGLFNTLMNIYPSLGDCMETIRCGEEKERGFCRNYGVSLLDDTGKYNLYYKNYSVGYISLSKHYVPIVELMDKYDFLREDVEENLLNV